MLTKFAVTNYRGFSERIELDLSNPNNYTFNTNAIKNGIIKNGIIYGPNGSGKSNLALAIFDIVNHLTQKWKKPDYYDNYIYTGNKTMPVSFEYTFNFDNRILEYKYSKDANGALVSEELIEDRINVFNRQKESLVINDSFPIGKKAQQSIVNSANNISVVNYLLSTVPLSKGHYLIKLQEFINDMLWFRCLESREFIGLVNNVVNLDMYIIQKGLVDDFKDFIHKVSNQQFNFAEPHENDKLLYCNYGDSKIAFDSIASTGTQSLMLLYYWIQQMDKASFVFIDEFDAFYHFRLSYEVCKKLFSLGCQVFVSSHNTYLMTNDLLRPDCNFILDNNKIKPLSECTEKELRFGHNIEKMFRGGTFTT